MTITYDHIRATLPNTGSETPEAPVRMSLLPQALLSMAGRRSGYTLYCHSGSLWLTQQGDPTDHILSAGDRFVTHGKGRLVLEALGETLVSVSPLKD